ncbi:hypothetical protein HDU76_001664, partial [Blyttiomyces sp. JEL0837]
MRSIPRNLALWLPALLDREDDFMLMEELADGFILVQILGIISPSSIDLTWYMSSEAMSCPDLTPQNRKLFMEGLRKTRIIDHMDKWDLNSFQKGDVDAAARVAQALWDWKCGGSNEGGNNDDDEKIVVGERRMNKGKGAAIVESQLSEMTLVGSGDDDGGAAGGGGLEFEKSEQRNVVDKELVIEYEPAEESFLSSVRWILSFVHGDHGYLQISDNVKSQVKHLQDSMTAK